MAETAAAKERSRARPAPERYRARTAAFRLLKIRQRSEKEIQDRLKQKGISREITDQTVQYLKEHQFIDDMQFARWWIHTRLAKPFGLKRIQFELKNKGIHDDIIRQELSRVKNNFAETEILEKLINRRISKYKNLDPIKRKRRLFEYLARRGFDIESIQKVIKGL